MNAGERMGTKCHICTGCGACLATAAEQGRIHVVTAVGDGMFGGKPSDGQVVPSYEEHNRGKRLVTADIGTTTIAMQFYGKDGRVEDEFVCVNPQIRYGADVLSRIQAAGDAEDMQRMVREKLAEGLGHFEKRLSRDESLFMVFAGNTTMMYLLMGYDPTELGHAPFSANRLEVTETTIAGVPCVGFPGLSAFVGGDIVAGMYACGIAEKEELTLFIDLGTNGEMALGNAKRRIACATAAGPAFEGGVNRGIWGADMVHLLATLRREHVVDETGLLADPYFEEGILIGNVRITQEAIRAVQLAKGAIGAGIRILMKEYGLTGQDGLPEYAAIDKVILAGGFGYYLRPEDAGCIGLLPPELVDRASAGGNTALAGALRLGRKILGGADGVWYVEPDGEERVDQSKIAALLAGCDAEVLNLAQHSDFEQLYLENMGL